MYLGHTHIHPAILYIAYPAVGNQKPILGDSWQKAGYIYISGIYVIL